jgi:zinc protease
VESVAEISRERLQDFHRRKYGPENCIVVIVGDIDLSVAGDEVDRRFGDWHNPDLELVSLEGLARQTEPVLETVLMDKEQVNLYLGHLGIARSSPDYYAAQVMDTVLGGGPGFTSRIPRHLRDEWGLAYLTYADLAGSAGIYPGRFVAYIGTAPENLARAREALHREIESFVEEGPRTDELEAAQAFLTGNFVFELQSNLSVARLLLLIEVFSLSAEYPDRYPDLIRSVTLSDVSRVARLYLDTLNYTTVIVGAS